MPMPQGLRSCLLGGLVLVVGCSSPPPTKPVETLARAEYAIAQARRAVGDDVQSVPLYEAEQKMETARKLSASDDRTEADVARAERLAERAVLDAELARARAGRRDAEARVADVEKEVDALRRQLDRTEGDDQ